MALAPLAAWIGATVIGCGSDAERAQREPCEVPAVRCVDPPYGDRGELLACVDGGIEHVASCPAGLACFESHDPGQAVCLAGTTELSYAAFAAEGAACVGAWVTRACTPTDETFLACVDSIWTNVCPSGFRLSRPCSEAQTDPEATYESLLSELSCAAEGGACPSEGMLECDGHAVFRCTAGAFVHAVDCGEGSVCRSEGDRVLCDERPSGAAGDPCKRERGGPALMGGESPPEGTVVACSFDESAILICNDVETWEVFETCPIGERCKGSVDSTWCE